MSVNAIDCCNVMLQSVEAQNQGATIYKIQNPGTLAALLLPDNLAGLSIQSLKDADGRIKKVLGLWPEQVRKTPTDAWPNICEPGDTSGQLSRELTALTPTSVKLTLSESEFRNFCIDDLGGTDISQNSFAQAKIRMATNQLIKAYSNKLLVQLAASAGNFADGTSTPKDAQLLKADGSVNHLGEVLISRAFEDIENDAASIIAVGAGNLSQYWRTRQYQCCSDAGININQVVAPFRYFRDPQTTSLVGADRFVAFAPGAAVPFFMQSWVGPFRRLFPDHSKTAITIPFDFNGISYELPVDFSVHYVKCPVGAGESPSPVENGDSQWVLTWTINGGLAVLPDNMEPSGSPFEGVNNILNFKATCGTPAFCS